MAAPTPQRRVAIFLALSLLLHAGAVWFAHSWRGQQRSLYVIYRPSQPDQQPFKRDSRAVVPADPRPLSAPTFNTPPREFAGWSDMLGRKGQTSGSPVGGLDTTGLALDVDRPEGRLEREALQAWKDSVYAALILEREANPLGPLDPFEIEMTALVQRRSTVVLDSTGRLLRGYWYFPVYEVYSTAPDPVICHAELRQLVSFHQIGFTLIDLDQDTYDSYQVLDDGLLKKNPFANIPSSLRQVIETNAPVYRRTRAEIRQPQDNVGANAGCILDVPFLGGTLALNSNQENAFTKRDIGILKQFAQVMSEAYRRLEDLQRLASQEQALVQSQKMEAIGQLAGGIFHDFNNMLTAILIACDFMLLDRGKDHSENQDLNLIKQAAEQAAMLTRQLLAFSRRQYLQPKVIDLNRIVTDTQLMLNRLIGEHIVQQTALNAEVGWVRVDPGQIEQILFNLAINARDAMPHGGRLVVETTNIELVEADGDIPPGTYVMLRISDTGVGRDEETQARIFEPFFTTKELGRGTGMGLATVYGVVQQSGGHIQVQSVPGTGTTFAIYLPLAEVELETETETETPLQDAALDGTETILLVEDDDMVRSVASAVLIRRGYQVLEAQDGAEALRVIAGHQGALDMVLTDVVMPGMNGEVLANRLLAERPHLLVLFMSGYLREAQLHDYPFLPKPFTPEILSRKVREVLDA